jgi:hypothetical protein
MRKVQCPELEATTFNWFTRMEEKGVALLDDLLVAAAKRLYELLPSDAREKELQFSSGSIEKFKRRYIASRVTFVTERMHHQILQHQFWCRWRTLRPLYLNMTLVMFSTWTRPVFSTGWNLTVL